jgi:amino acid permease
MLKILFVMVTILIITALVFWVTGVRYLKTDKYNKTGIKYILGGTSVTGICIILSAILFIPVFFPV